MWVVKLTWWGQPMKILIVEDDADARTLMVDILSSAQVGYELLPAPDGLSAWQALQVHDDVSLAIVDLTLPGLSGLELITRMQGDKRFAEIPIIVCTGNTDRTTVGHVAAKGIRNFLVKPFTRATVLDRVLQLCRPTITDAPVVRDLSGARQRHEIDRETHRELLGHYIRVADLWAGDARRASDFARVRGLAIRALHLRQMLGSLGAAAAAARLQEAEQALGVYRVKPLASEMHQFLKLTQQHGEKLARELERLREVLETI